MIKVGDLVVLKDAKIRGPDGVLKELEEAPYYGVVLGIKILKTEDVCRVMWFNRDGSTHPKNKGTTLEFFKELEKISK